MCAQRPVSDRMRNFLNSNTKTDLSMNRWWLTALAICLTLGHLAPLVRAQDLHPAKGAPADGQYPRTARWAGPDAQIDHAELPQPPIENLAPDAVLMTIADLEQMALSHNPTVAQAWRQVQALRGRYVQQGLYPNPVVGYVAEEIGDEGAAGQQGVAVGQQVVTAGKLGLNRAVVSHEIAQARSTLEIQRKRVVNDVRIASYIVLTAQRTIALTEQLVRIGREGQEVAEELLKAREVSQVDLLQARIEANSANVLLANAQNEYQAAWRRLSAVVGVPDLQPTPLRDDISADPPQLAWEDTLMRLLAASPELARAQAGVERAQCNLARQYAGRVPNFDVLAAGRYNFASDDTVASVNLAVPLQIFNRNQGNILQAQAELAAARQEVSRVELSLQQRLAAAFKDYANAQQQVVQYESYIIPDAKQSLSLMQQGYRQGEFGYLELLTSQRTYFRVNLTYVSALRDLWVNATRIDGMLLTGALQQP